MIVTVAVMLVVLVIVAAQARPALHARASQESVSAPRHRPGRHPLRYRVWAGLSLWLGATALDLALKLAEPAWWPADQAGALSVIGFVLAFAWSLFDPDRR